MSIERIAEFLNKYFMEDMEEINTAIDLLSITINKTKSNIDNSISKLLFRTI
ncbi:MAG TPA: hypothetical protein GX725_02300 [Mollicutes bacterium]|nr:hypothetical protein [Mollicutes bacterium]